MKICELIKSGAEELAKNLDGVNARFESELLLSFAVKKERIYLILHGDDEIDKEESDLFLSYVTRRACGEPYSYITGEKEFMSLKFFVSPGVLIPRPDTETLVNHVIDNFADKKPLIVDLCTGSGAIAVSCVKYISGAKAYAYDISDVCINTARKNAEENGVADNVDVSKADVLKGLDIPCAVDCIVSNPPYIKSDVLPSLMKDVRDYEPALALDGGDDGLIFYRKISEYAPAFLKKNGMLAFEIGHDQAEEVEKILAECGFSEIELKKDLAGINRVISGKKR